MKTTRNISLHHILMLLFFIIATSLYGENISDYNRWMKLNTKELMERASGCKQRGSIDSALVYYSIVSNRHDEDSNEEIRYRCLSYTEKALIYFSRFSDYSKAFENLVYALELKNDNNRDTNAIHKEKKLHTKSNYVTIFMLACGN